MSSFADEMYQVLSNEFYHKLKSFIDDSFKGIYVVLQLIDKNCKPMISGEIATKLNISTARVAVALATLKTKGYVSIHKDSNDKRITVVEITDKGIDALRTREQQLIDKINSVTNCLNDNERNTLLNIVRKLCNPQQGGNIC